jgi:hypothetical protein
MRRTRAQREQTSIRRVALQAITLEQTQTPRTSIALQTTLVDGRC